MNKKVGCLVTLLLFIIFISNVFAESEASASSFSVRNGIQFGDSVEEVKKKDEAFKDIEAKPFSFSKYEIIYPNSLECDDIELVGIPMNLKYFFDEAGLKEFRYYITHRPSLVISKDMLKVFSFSQLETAYDVLEQSLTKKYGDKLDENDPLTELIEPEASSIQRPIDGLAGLRLEFTREGIRLSDWLVKYDNYYVKITLNLVQENSTDGRLTLSYYMVTEEEFDALYAAYANKIREIEDDINNSI